MRLRWRSTGGYGHRIEAERDGVRITIHEQGSRDRYYWLEVNLYYGDCNFEWLVHYCDGSEEDWNEHPLKKDWEEAKRIAKSLNLVLKIRPEK